jgi:hypothetical protein
VVLETVAVKPLLCYCSIFGFSGSKESNYATFIVPFIDNIPSIGQRVSGRVQVAFFVLDIIADCTVDVN